MNNEDYEFIKGYENLYKINRNGDIWSCKYNKIMTPQINKDGYKFITLSIPKELMNNIVKYKRCKGYIHRLLGLQYIENPENKETIDHIDRNKINNDLSNLRWYSRAEQANNKANNISNLNEEELEERKIKKREYQRLWIEKKNRAKGVKPKPKGDERKTANSKEYQAELRLKKGMKPRKLKKDFTPEELEERRVKDREYKKEWIRNKRLNNKHSIK